MIVTPEELAAIEAQAIEEYPSECCGMVMIRGDERRLLRCRNIQDELHAKDPERHVRDSHTAYSVDIGDLRRMEQLSSEGFALAVIYHSHIDVGAYFSPTDKSQAMHGRDPKNHEPLWLDTTYIVVSVRKEPDKVWVDESKAFRWNGARRDFVETSFPVGVGGPRS